MSLNELREHLRRLKCTYCGKRRLCVEYGGIIPENVCSPCAAALGQAHMAYIKANKRNVHDA